MSRITNYRSYFNRIINNASNEFDGCVEVFNEIANSRFFEHMSLSKTEDNRWSDFSGKEPWMPTTTEELCSELCYWLSCYYEEGNVRHDEEYSDRTMLIRGLEVLKSRCNWDAHRCWYSLPLEKAELKNLA